MSALGQPSRFRRIGFSSVRALLALILLGATAILFAQSWNGISTTSDTTQREIDGIAFLRTLQPVLTTLANDASVAVSQEKVDFTELDKSVSDGTAAQHRYGSELATQARWDDFTAKLADLHKLKATTAPLDAFNQYTAASDQLLALYDRIRAESGLASDQELDIYYLQDAAARALPSAVITAGQFGDSLVVEQQSPKSADVQTGTINAVSYRALLTEHSNDVGTDVSAAVDATASQTMSSALLQHEDAFLTAIEPLTVEHPVVLGTTNDESSALHSKTTIETNAANLSDALLNEIATQVQQRSDSQGGTEALTIIAFVAAVLLTLGVLFASIRSGGRRGGNPRGGGAGRAAAHKSADRRELERAGVPA